MKYRAFAALIAVFTCFQVFAQSTVTGIVTDAEGEPLVAAGVQVVGTKNLVMTASDGRYSIKAQKGDVLEFTMIGKKTQTVTYNGQARVNVILEDDVNLLEDVVVIGYGTQKRQSITGAISKVDGDKLAKAPAQNVTNLMGGVIPGVISYQSSGVPGGDGSSLLVRGQGVKAIVDGVARSIDDLDPNEIESISVLKDASAVAVYGFDAGAVIITTTKRSDNQKSRISYHGTMTFSSNALQLELLDGPAYAYYYNLGRQMDGNTPVFSRKMVEAMTNGDDSDGWGNTNWYKEVFGTGITHNHTISAQGGTDRINYFATIGYYKQNGNVSGYSHDRINIRSNVEAKIAKNLTLTVGLLGRFTRTDAAGISADPDSWNNLGIQLMRIHPYVPKTFEGYTTATRNASSVSAIKGFLDDGGYSWSKGNLFQGTGTLRYDVPFIKGLSLKAMVAYDVNQSYYKSHANPFDVMVATRPLSMTVDAGDPLLGIRYTLANGFPSLTQTQVSQGTSNYNQLITNLSAEYGRTFGKHEVSALVLMESNATEYGGFGGTGYNFAVAALDDLNFAQDKEKNAVSGSSSHYRSLGFVGRLNYSYDNRYLLELSGRIDGLYTFYGSTKVWGVFPGASFGWRIDREKWFNAPAVNLLKFRVGTGMTGSASGVAAYTYANQMQLMNATAVIGGKTASSFYTTVPGDPDLTWAKNFQVNVGVDLNMWDGKLRFEGDVFYKYLYDMIAGAGNLYPASWGGRYPSYTNANKQDHRGFEFLLEHRNRVQDFSYGVSLVGSYTYRRWLKYSDSANWPDYWKLTGKEVGSVIGFIAQGLFQSQEEIDNSPTIPGNKPRVGDIKYVDRNGDGKITYDQDMGYVGSSVFPKFEGGINFDAAWKGFDFVMRWTYGLGRTIALTGVYSMEGSAGIQDNTAFTKPFYHDGNSPLFLLENSLQIDADGKILNPDARFPRLTVDAPNTNNAYSSTWWYENGDYIRLKNIQLGYSLPKKWMKAIGMQSCRVFVEGTNLLTFSHVTKYNIDPEMPSVNNGYYPQQRLMGFGIDLKF
ncbi:MAG: TonB-dependent receptor [Bacteroidales bacterium]|nr:TonB-dependent receptor [Bacteroidales bacterium]